MWFSPVDFGDAEWQKQKRSLKRVADVSRGNSFASVNLLNYTDAAFPAFMRSEAVKERPHDNAEFEEWQITGYQAPTDIRGVMTSALLDSHRRPRSRQVLQSGDSAPEDTQVLGNSNYRLLVAWRDSLRVIDISARAGGDVEARSDAAFRSLSDAGIDPVTILDTRAFGKGFLVELREEVLLINTQGCYSVISEPVARIRTFAHSRRHREVILLVRENGVSLLGTYLKREVELEY